MAAKSNSKSQKATSRAASTGDERLVRGSSPEVRGDRGVAEDAQRTQETGLLSTDELDKLIREEFEQTALPTAPDIPGYHTCWLTTSSQYDSIQKRQRLGYAPVRQDELPGFDPSNGQALSKFEGFITCNEMVLHKIPMARYQAIMKFFHHTKPMEEEASIVNKAETQNGQEDSSGKSLGSFEGDGMTDLKKSVERAMKLNPVFS